MATPETDALDRADMARLVSGHEAALNDLMARHGPAVFHFLCRLLNNEEDANDLAQETFVRVFRSCETFQPDRKFSTWLFTIAANLARNQMRWRTRHPNVSLDAEGDESGQSLGGMLPAKETAPNEHVLRSERATAVRAAVNALPDEMREAIILCEWEERSINEAAAILEATPKAVESRLYRARQTLRARLMEWLR